MDPFYLERLIVAGRRGNSMPDSACIFPAIKPRRAGFMIRRREYDMKTMKVLIITAAMAAGSAAAQSCGNDARSSLGFTITSDGRVGFSYSYDSNPPYVVCSPPQVVYCPVPQVVYYSSRPAVYWPSKPVIFRTSPRPVRGWHHDRQGFSKPSGFRPPPSAHGDRRPPPKPPDSKHRDRARR